MKVSTKYNGILELSAYMDHLVNSIFKLLPMYEKNEDWQKYLNNLMYELAGLDKLINRAFFASLLGNLEGMFTIKTHAEFKIAVFNNITLIKKIKELEDYDDIR